MKEFVTDRWGNTIYLTDERWQHIIEGHPEIGNFRHLVLETIQNGKRIQDEYEPYKYYYQLKHNDLPDDHERIEVVVLMKFDFQGSPNNFIVT